MDLTWEDQIDELVERIEEGDFDSLEEAFEVAQRLFEMLPDDLDELADRIAAVMDYLDGQTEDSFLGVA